MPIEDQGYLLVAVQLPDGASLARTRGARRGREIARRPGRRPGRHHRRHLGPRQQRRARQRRRRLRDPQGLGERAGPGPAVAVHRPDAGAHERRWTATSSCSPPPPIQGIGNAGGFTMKVELRDGSADFAKLQSVTDTIVERGSITDRAGARAPPRSAPARRSSMSTSTATKAETLKVRSTRSSPRCDLSGLELRQPVQPVRPHVPGLRAGRRASRLQPDDIRG